jgi:phosphatidate cytidylyltransferase
MERSLRNRLTFGPMMLAALGLLLWLDDFLQYRTRGWYERHVREWYERHRDTIDGRISLPDIGGGGVGGVGLLILLAIILPIAVRELATLFTAERIKPYRFIASLGSAALIVHAFLTQFPFFRPIAASTFAFIVVFIMLGAALQRAWQKQTQEAITHMAGTVLATLYLGGLGWFLMAIRVKHSTGRHDFHGTTWVVLTILLCVKFTDIGAYFGGRKFGRHKLIYWLSPGKTWEGLFFGLLTAGIVGSLCSFRLPRHPDWWLGFIFGAIIGGIGQLGDLLESLMKRDAEVKDSGSLVPGFGGILDIIDSPLLAAPFAYLIFSFF